MTEALLQESRLEFPCFGGAAAVVAAGPDAERRVLQVRALLERGHAVLTRFDPGSELSLLNASRAQDVRVSELMARFVREAVDAARSTGGLVDPTLTGEIEALGYRADLASPGNLATALVLAPPRAPARPDPDARWRSVTVNGQTVSRPAGVRLDSGGVAKGMLADMAAELLAGCDSFAVDCAGDLRLGGRGGRLRAVRLDDPFGRGSLYELELAAGGVATSGIGRRAWIAPDGAPAHHLLDPSTGHPAYTGVVQATALAPTAAEAEVLAKAALLSGPVEGRRRLVHGGALVRDDGTYDLIDAP